MEVVEKPKRIYFEHLDVVRFMAAFMIVILHTYEAWTGWYAELFIDNGELAFPGGQYLNQFLKNLGLGVDVFFLISGFLITYILLEEKKRMGKIHVGKFMMRRSLRIWPLYYFLIIISPFLVKWAGTPDPNYLYNALFIGNFDIIETKKWMYPFAHFWSICIEEHFYLVWPFIIAFIPKPKLLLTFGVLILGSMAFRMYTMSSLDFPWYTLYAHTVSRIDVLVIGAIGAYFYSEKPFEMNIPKYVRVSLWVTLIVALSVEPVVNWDSVFLAGFKKFFYMGIIAILLMDFNFNPNYKHKLKAGSVIHYFGKISYGIYMYHNVIYIIVIKHFMWTYQIKSIPIFFAVCFALSLIIPIISYELFEKHFLKWTKKFRVIETKR